VTEIVTRLVRDRSGKVTAVVHDCPYCDTACGLEIGPMNKHFRNEHSTPRRDPGIE
jgi:hypothetical protein